MWKKVFAAVVMVGVVLSGMVVLPVASVYADESVCSDPNISDDLKAAAGCKKTETADKVANNVINVVLTLVGILAVGVMIFGGITYVTSTGDASKTMRAKNIIMYGLIGLMITLLAYAIVFFVSGSISAPNA